MIIAVLQNSYGGKGNSGDHGGGGKRHDNKLKGGGESWWLGGKQSEGWRENGQKGQLI